MSGKEIPDDPLVDPKGATSRQEKLDVSPGVDGDPISERLHFVALNRRDKLRLIACHVFLQVSAITSVGMILLC